MVTRELYPAEKPVDWPSPRDYKIVYLSGPMRGYPNENRPAFNALARILRSLGFVVINPCETAGGESHLSAQWFMAVDIHLLQQANAIFLMEGWRESRGAKTEAVVASAVGIPLLEWRIHSFYPIGIGEIQLQLEEGTDD